MRAYVLVPAMLAGLVIGVALARQVVITAYPVINTKIPNPSVGAPPETVRLFGQVTGINKEERTLALTIESPYLARTRVRVLVSYTDSVMQIVDTLREGDSLYMYVERRPGPFQVTNMYMPRNVL